MSIAVVDEGRVVFAEGFGILQHGHDEPIDSETLFQAASISKPVAALCALRLVDRGVLDLDADVNDKLESWQVPTNEFTSDQSVTLRRLLCHGAGTDRARFPGYGTHAELPTVVDILDGTGLANTDPIRVDMRRARNFATRAADTP